MNHNLRALVGGPKKVVNIRRPLIYALLWKTVLQHL